MNDFERLHYALLRLFVIAIYKPLKSILKRGTQ